MTQGLARKFPQHRNDLRLLSFVAQWEKDALEQTISIIPKVRETKINVHPNETSNVLCFQRLRSCLHKAFEKQRYNDFPYILQQNVTS